jgi:hypothetical protein
MLASQIAEMSSHLDKTFQNSEKKTSQDHFPGLHIAQPKDAKPQDLISALMLHATRRLCEVKAQVVSIPAPMRMMC